MSRSFATWVSIAAAVAMAGCAKQAVKPDQVNELIVSEVARAAAHRPREAENPQVQDALLPPLKAQLPLGAARALEPRFDLSVNNAPATQVFTAIVTGTPYSMLLHPDVKGSVTVTFKDTTVREALDALRDLYGYEYRIEGTRIFVHAASIQTRVFRVNYMTAQRLGRSDIRVTSGSLGENATSTGPQGPAAGTTGTAPTGGNAAQGSQGQTGESSRIQTSVRSDFWEDLKQTLEQIVGRQGGRSVVVNPQAGIIVVRAMPDELRHIADYLREIRLSVERQVMLEAKIVEVTLSEQHQTGVNWALFSGSGRFTAGQLNPGSSIASDGRTGTFTTPNVAITAQPGAANLTTAAAAASLIQGFPGGALLGLAFQVQNFASVLDFLESQGSVQVLSSPRIATLNNQKALLKVGTDEFFITGISGGASAVPATSTSVGTSSQFPTLTLRPFFSGVALDITPQIDNDSILILHIHPSVSNVQQDDKNVNLGTAFGGRVTLPLPRSTVSETDSVVRVRDGNIVAIGGLMKLDVADNRSGLPGLKDLPSGGELFGNARRTVVKKELIILIKPTVIQSEEDWAGDVRETRDRLERMGRGAAPLSRR